MNKRDVLSIAAIVLFAPFVVTADAVFKVDDATANASHAGAVKADDDSSKDDVSVSEKDNFSDKDGDSASDRAEVSDRSDRSDRDGISDSDRDEVSVDDESDKDGDSDSD